MFLDQRDAVSARASGGLRRLAADGAEGLGLGRCAALLQEVRGLRRRPKRDARRRRRMAGREPAPALGSAGRLDQGRRRRRHPRKHGFQHRRQRRRGVFPGEPARRLADEHRQGLLAHHLGPQSAGRDPRPDHPPADRRPQGRRRGIPPQRPAAPGPRRARSHPVRRGGEFPQDPAIVRDRPRRPSEDPRDRGAAGHARHRRQPSGSPAAALLLAAGRREDPEHHGEFPAGQAGDRGRLRPAAARPDDHGPVTAGGLYPVASRPGNARSGIPRPAPVA